MALYQQIRSWRAGLLIAFALFLVTRALTWRAFPIFNDEALYLQYAQSIHDDWQPNKFISMNGFYHDWKPPLQYWITAPFIGIGGDPLLAGRAIALLVSAGGLLGLYLWTRELFGLAEAVIAAALYALCPTVLFHNDQFTAETFLFATAPFLYYAVLKMMAPGRARFVWVAIAVGSGAALLLLKQSGFLLLVVALALPFARLRRSAPDHALLIGREFRVNCLLTLAVVLLAQLLAMLVIPSEFNATKERFNSHWVMSAAEVLQLPLATWRTNLAMVGEYVGAYYGWTVPVFIAVFMWVAVRGRRMPELALAAMCCAGGFTVCFLLRGFNEYMFNTAMIVALLPLLARSAVLVWNLRRVVLRRCLLALAAVTLAFWSYQIVLIALSPGRYIERSTRWAIANYLQSWSTGFGVDEVLAMLGATSGPVVVFADTQWGNPRTPIELYRARRFPNVRVYPITKEFLDERETQKLRDHARTLAPVHLAIFSADPSGVRAQWQANVMREMCESRTEVKPWPRQTPIVVCRF